MPVAGGTTGRVAVAVVDVVCVAPAVCVVGVVVKILGSPNISMFTFAGLLKAKAPGDVIMCNRMARVPLSQPVSADSISDVISNLGTTVVVQSAVIGRYA